MLKIEPVAYSIDNSIINNVEFKIANINNFIRVSLINKNEYDVKIKYVKIAETNFSPESEFYGEGYSMLSSYGGTLANPKHIGSYDEETHYKIKNAKDAFTVYNLIKIRENGHIMLMAFSSCNRFVGEFHIKNGLVEVWMHIENYEHTVATAVTNSNLKVLFFSIPPIRG